jgi:aspartyl-tRNA(Asn)/glutamyl-tRNA(Gln) amidotransferase subunit A
VAADHAGIPGISVPAGLDARRRPIGIQLLGADFSEGMLLRVAHAFEQATADQAWRSERPMVLL